MIRFLDANKIIHPGKFQQMNGFKHDVPHGVSDSTVFFGENTIVRDTQREVGKGGGGRDK